MQTVTIIIIIGDVERGRWRRWDVVWLIGVHHALEPTGTTQNWNDPRISLQVPGPVQQADGRFLCVLACARSVHVCCFYTQLSSCPNSTRVASNRCLSLSLRMCLAVALGHKLSVSSARVSHVGCDMRLVAEQATIPMAALAFCCEPTGTTTARVCLWGGVEPLCCWTLCCRQLGRLIVEGCPLWPKAWPAVVTFAVHRGPTGAGLCSTAALAATTPS